MPDLPQYVYVLGTIAIFFGIFVAYRSHNSKKGHGSKPTYPGDKDPK